MRLTVAVIALPHGASVNATMLQLTMCFEHPITHTGQVVFPQNRVFLVATKDDESASNSMNN